MRNYADERLRNPDKVSAELMAIMKRERGITLDRYVAAQRKTVAFKAHVDSLFDKVDVLLCPSAPGEAPKGQEFTGDPRFNSIWTLAGTPCVTLPAGRATWACRSASSSSACATTTTSCSPPPPGSRRTWTEAQPMPKINGERLLADLRRIADFGRYETGVHRPHLSPQDVESRHWLAGRMKEAGLEPVIDGVGTVLGRSPKSGPAHPDRLAFRHPAARRLARRRDGRDLRPRSGARAGRGSRDGASRRRRRLVGRRGGPLGPDDRQPLVRRHAVSEADIDKSRHRDEGTPMRDALKAAGLDKTPREHFEDGRYRGYLEAHIEQGGLLEASDKRIGIVTAIVGIYVYRLTFSGIQNHAGTTPMPIRKDAGVAMMRLYNEVMETLSRRSPARAASGRSARCRSSPARRRSSPARPR